MSHVLSFIDFLGGFLKVFMKLAAQVGVCRNCGHLLVRSASSLVGVSGSKNIQLESRRSIWWRPIFVNLLKTPGASTTPGSQSSSSEDARKHAELAVRRLREAKDRAKRPDNSPTAPSPEQFRSDSTPESKKFVPQQSNTSEDRLRQLLLSSGHTLLKETRSSNVGGSIRQQKQAIEKLDHLAFSKSQKPFKSPLRLEQKEALRKYLEMSSSKKEPSKKREKYPWEELPIPWDTGVDKLKSVRQLLDHRSFQMSERIKHQTQNPPTSVLAEDYKGPSIEGTRDSDILASVQLLKSLRVSKLYQLLRNHHDRSWRAWNNRDIKLRAAANLDLEIQLNSSMRQLEERYGTVDWFRMFQALLQSLIPQAADSHSMITPLIQYILARGGFCPNIRGQHPIDKIPEGFLSTGVYDNFNRLKPQVLHEILRTEYESTFHKLCDTEVKFSIDVIQQIHAIPASSNHPTLNFMLISGQRFLPLSKTTLERHGIVIRIQDGNILLRSKDTIQLWLKDRIAPLKEIDDGAFLRRLEGERVSYIEWISHSRRFTELYDF